MVAGQSLVIGGLILCFVSLVGAEPATLPATRPLLARPTTQQLAAARKQVDELYRSTDAVHALRDARELLASAQSTTSDTALRYAAAYRAMELAARGGDATLALEAVAELTAQYDCDGAALRIEVVTQLIRAKAFGPAATVAMRALDECLKQGRLPMAEKVAALLLSVRKEVRPELASVVGDVLDDYEFGRKLAERLTTRPSSRPTSRPAMSPGFACLYQGRWQEQLGELAKANGDLAPLAKVDLEAADLASRLAAAEEWWNAGQQRGGKTGWRLAERAAMIYEANLQHADGVHRQLIQSRLAAHHAAAMPWQGYLPGLVREVWKDGGPATRRRSISSTLVLEREGNDPAIPKEHGHVAYSGVILVEVPGQYELTFVAGTTLRVVLDGQVLVDNPTAYRKRSGEQVPLKLAAGLHRLEIEVSANSSRPHLGVEWMTPVKPESGVVPGGALYHDALRDGGW